ncbi:multicopper oxidase family protein [Breoghania sp. L-A4]|uniref:multicopper oxidase family protein n=1 Tax=Breoghania sp. L-A4 TaxID=2304600 RepID=UPI000E35DA18|nr:multicopper oxidase family protein [Breoghania sp. L-A4]AXS39600.1 copper oxidase [Breoghania sp. L-A4]
MRHPARLHIRLAVHPTRRHNTGHPSGGIAAGRLVPGLVTLLALLAFAAPLSPARAQVGSRAVIEPPSAELRTLAPPERLDTDAPLAKRQPQAIAPQALSPLAPMSNEGRGPGTEVFYDLAITYTQGTLYNPATGHNDAVNLRSYVGDVTSQTVPFVGPRVDIWPGETFRLTLRNQLPADDPSCALSMGDPNIPHCFNTTNMHTHGLWVSPTGNSDNVLLSVKPGVDFQYEYNIPSDHPAGTFWYHSHLHGSTALQVSSGMAGALVIHGDRLPQALPGGGVETGDIDTLLRSPQGTPFRDRLVLFQQIAYACRNADGAIKTNPDGTWKCDPGDVGTIEGYDQFGPPAWNASGRYTSINGVVEPTFKGAVAGQVERWRLVHAGVRDTINVRFRKLEPSATVLAYNAVSSDARQDFVDANCKGAPLPEMVMASDGLTRGKILEQQDTVLQPGYRQDLLMVFPEPGTYCIIDGELEAEETVNSQEHGRELLGYVEVAASGAPSGEPANVVVQRALVTAAQTFMPPDVRASVVADLEDGLKLSAFIDQPDIAENEVTGQQTLGFRIFVAGLEADSPVQFEIGELGQDFSGNTVLWNAAPYAPDRIDRTLMLDGVDEWTLTSFTGGHPFHIHVNPFQIVSITDASGADVSVAGSNSQYAGLKGVWKDTLFIEQGVTFTTRTRYRRYIGEFVLHCHILDHEDQGMMQNISIAIPDGSGGVAAMGHQ